MGEWFQLELPHQLEGSSHNSEGTAPHSSGCCRVGSSVGRPHYFL